MRVSRLLVVPAATAVVLGLSLSALFLGTSGQTGPTPTTAQDPYARSAAAPDTSTTINCGTTLEIVPAAGPSTANATVTMPNLVGESLNQAETELSCSGIRYTVLSVPTQSAPANSVLDQSPAAGTTVRLPATVHLTVAFG